MPKPLAAASRSRDARRIKKSRIEEELKSLEDETAHFTAPENFIKFDQLPLSPHTRKGLKAGGFKDMTDIQAKSLPLSLARKDVLGAARTGSGKTLAFLIPILELLYRARWSGADGLGALVLSPTRELALQIFSVLRSIGSSHSFSAGLIIGGKGSGNDVAHEAARLGRMNIVIATPGRLLQHMDQTIGFDCSNLQVLVLDEADRILDMGFAKTLDAILENVPKQRQTLLFSATQTKRVGDLARLSLSNPEYVAVREAVQPAEGEDAASDPKAADANSSSIPRHLMQHYMIVPLPTKLSLLFSFLRTHTSSKLLIFFSSCRQVQFVHDVFSKLRPGLSIMALHGKQKQPARLRVYGEFAKARHAALIATDVAARGLDFAGVDWVIQADAPEDVDTYIHRIGRTARAGKKGNALTFLLPNEEKGMLARWAQKGIIVESIKAREKKTLDIQNQLQSFAFQSPDTKHLAQKAFVSYVRSIHLQKDKSTFDVLSLPLEPFAASLGLPGAPRVKFIKEEEKKRAAAAKAAAKAARQSELDRQDGEVDGEGKVRTKYDRMFERKNQNILSEHWQKLVADEDSEVESAESDGESSASGASVDATQMAAPRALFDGNEDRDDGSDAGDFITLKRANHGLDDDGGDAAEDLATASLLPSDPAHLSKRRLMQGASKKASAAAGARGAGKKMIFDADGTPREAWELGDEEQWRKEETAAQAAARIALEKGEGEGGVNAIPIVGALARKWAEEEAQHLAVQDAKDKELAREKKRERRRKEKEREKELSGDMPRAGKKRKADSEDEGEEDADGPVVLAPIDERSDGYETPDFELPDASDDSDSDGGASSQSDEEEPDSEEEQRRLSARVRGHKKQRTGSAAPQHKGKDTPVSLADTEALALRLLRAN